MNYDLAQLMKKALVQNLQISKTAQEQKHPLQASFEEKHGIKLLDVLNRKLRLAENDEIEKDLVFIIKELIFPNESMSTPDYFAENWGDDSGEVSIRSVFSKLEELEREVDRRGENAMESYGYAPDRSKLRREVANDYEIDYEYQEYFNKNMGYSGSDADEEDLKLGIHPDLLEKISEYQNK